MPRSKEQSDLPLIDQTRRDKHVLTVVRDSQDAERTITHVISAKVVDRDGDVIEPRGMRADAYRKNPVVLLGHGYGSPIGSMPIGRNLGLEVSDQEIVAVTQFAGLDQSFTEAETVYRLYRDGFMRAFSIGFIPKTVSYDKILPGQDGLWFKEWELLEYSAVAVPSNPEAVLRFCKGYGLPTGASEKDLMDAIKTDRSKFFDIGASLVKAKDIDPGVAPAKKDDEPAVPEPEPAPEEAKQPEPVQVVKAHVDRLKEMWRTLGEVIGELEGLTPPADPPASDPVGPPAEPAKQADGGFLVLGDEFLTNLKAAVDKLRR